MNTEEALRVLYARLIEGWNAGDAETMAGAVAPDGLVVGFDGSQMSGRDEVEAELGRIFADHETATYVTKVRSVKSLGASAGILHAVAGMVQPGGSEIMPDRNAIQTVVGRRAQEGWSVALSRRLLHDSMGAPKEKAKSVARRSQPEVDPSDGPEQP
jgi:uncharacterized protein (TIGR02246 family)